MSTLSGKRILLGVTGSIAAYKAADILRRLKEQGAVVRVVMTKNAARFVSKLTFETLSEMPVLIDEFAEHDKAGIGHILATDDADLSLIAPATANIIGKIAAGIADDALTSAVMALECPIVIAPAMNDRMYRNPVLQRNIRFLKEQGVRFIEPETGPLACGTVGQGRLADPDGIVQEIVSFFSPKELSGVNVLVTAGPTQEPLDAVRFISNPSTGKMGYAVAQAARERGASVTLISGPTHLTPPPGIKVIKVRTAAEMRRAVMASSGESRVVIMAAAVSDFKPALLSDRKVKKDSLPPVLQLERTDDILRELGSAKGRLLLVGFAAETDNVVENAVRKLKDKNLDLIVVNNVLQEGTGFGCDTNAVTIIDRSGSAVDIPMMTKTEVAVRVIDKIVELAANTGILP